MSNYDNNVYYAPEKWGLTVIAEMEYTGGYEFNTRVVWQDKEGRLYTAQDSGCSCPTPFEDFNTYEDLSPVDIGELEAEIQKHLQDCYSSISPLQGREFIKAVKAAMKKQ